MSHSIDIDAVDLALAILTLSVAIIVAVITFGQWTTSRNTLKLELFERRYEIYEAIAKFLADIKISGRLEKGREIEFLRDTKRAYFLFQADPSVRRLISEIHSKAVDLWACGAEEDGLSEVELSENLKRQREIKDWMGKTLESMESKFEKYLKLKH